MFFIQAKQAFSLNFAAKKRESFEFTLTRIGRKANSSSYIYRNFIVAEFGLNRNKKSQNERASVCDSCCSNRLLYCINLRCCFGFRKGSRLF